MAKPNLKRLVLSDARFEIDGRRHRTFDKTMFLRLGVDW
jgi:hypothetical protein